MTLAPARGAPLVAIGAFVAVLLTPSVALAQEAPGRAEDATPRPAQPADQAAGNPGGTVIPGAPAPGVADPVAAGAADAAPDAVAAAAATWIAPYARIDTEQAVLRCFPTDHSPTYGEQLAVGDVVIALELENGYRAVRLPLGVLGYVHKRFTELVEDQGVVQNKAKKLSFRYRPNSNEAPIRFVDEDTTFHLVAEEGDWWVVRFPDATAWVAESDVLVFDDAAPVDTLEAGWRDLEARHRGVVEAVVAERRAQREAAAAAAQRQSALAELRTRFVAERQKPDAEQAYDALLADLGAVVDGLAEGDPATVDAALLRRQIENHVRSLQAIQLVREEPVPAYVEEPKPAIRDPLRHLSAVGWLHYDDSLFGTKTFRLEKGGQVQFFVTCSSGRYDLRLYDGMEIGVRGTADRPHLESMRVLDVNRIEVFARRDGR